MIKTLLITILSLFAFSSVQAKSLVGLRVSVTENIVRDCVVPTALGCYHGEIKTIYLSDKLEEYQIETTLYHELGHYFMEDVTEEEFNKVFGAVYGFWVEKKYIQEYAASTFSFWLLGGSVPKEQRDFFIKKVIQ